MRGAVSRRVCRVTPLSLSSFFFVLFFVLHLIFFLISMDSEENVMMSPVNDSSPLSVDDPEMIFGHSSSVSYTHLTLPTKSGV